MRQTPFLRPIKINRLKIGDINIEEKTFQFKAKNSPIKTKIIPEILLKELPNLSELNKDHYLFTTNKIGGEWNSSESSTFYYQNFLSITPIGCEEVLIIISKSITPKINSSSVITSTFHNPCFTLFLNV